MTIGRRIETIRKEKGWSRQQLAGKCPERWLTLVVLKQIEYDRRPQKYEEALLSVARALGVSISQLFGVETKNEDVAKMAKDLENLSSELVKKIMELE